MVARLGLRRLMLRPVERVSRSKAEARSTATEDAHRRATSLTVNRRFRDECLNEHLFRGLPMARRIMEAWRIGYNRCRPHTSLGGLTHKEFAARSREDDNQNGFSLLTRHSAGNVKPAPPMLVLTFETIKIAQPTQHLTSTEFAHWHVSSTYALRSRLSELVPPVLLPSRSDLSSKTLGQVPTSGRLLN